MAGLLDGFLPALYSKSDQLKRRVKGLLTNPRAFLGELNEDAKTEQDQRSAADYLQLGLLAPKSSLGQSDPAWVSQQAELGRQQYENMALNGLTVWHGSPHKFDKFDAAHIGKGEGAQAYGHGLYLAENPRVAEEYADKLAKVSVDGGWTKTPRVATYGGVQKRRIDTNVPSENLTPAEMAVTYVNIYGSKFEAKAALDDMASVDGMADAAKYKQASRLLDRLDLRKIGAENGHLYKVDLPDSAIDKMLDWDKPLAQQSDEIKAVVKSFLPAPVYDNLLLSPAGDVVKALERWGNTGFLPKGSPKPRTTEELASALLYSKGIPGIKYLDGGSRGAGQGTRNFVVFDDQLPKILEVNGGLLGR